MRENQKSRRVLPSPAIDPRRADNLIDEYRELLFSKFRADPTNIIYACEWNPFEVYRQIRRTIKQYNVALEALGGCKAFVSSTSSKLLSVGALLAAYECKYGLGLEVGVANVEARGYTKKRSDVTNEEKPHSLWLAGECYDD